MEQVIWWIKIIVNKVKSASMTIPSGSYLATFTDIPVHFQYDGRNDILRNKKYIELPANIFDMFRDDGVNWLAYSKVIMDEDGKVCYCEPVYFQRTTLIEAREMQYNPHEKPSELVPYFIRINNLLYLPGVETVSKFRLDAALYITEKPYIGDMNLDDEILLNDEQIADVVSRVMSLGRFVMLVPKERVNEGDDTRDIPLYKQLSAMAASTQNQDQPQQ